jgi:hypothetical protein
MTPTAQSLQGFRNRIINGAMVIAQRGTTFNSIADFTYTVDRWLYQGASSKFNIVQNGGGVTPPSGFTNYLGMTVVSAITPAAGDYFRIQQRVEGFNVSDLGWGAAGAQSVTVSFWVRSSLTGTFGGSVMNNAANRSYPFPFTVSAANTWEQKTIVIPGDITGTWLTDNGVGVTLSFSLGSGSTFTATGNVWGATSAHAPTGSQYVVSTNGATFYITGVQLEAGSVATPFERRDYGRELIMCQRYYQKYGSLLLALARIDNGAIKECRTPRTVTMRATPTETGTLVNVSSVTFAGSDTSVILVTTSATTNSSSEVSNYAASSEL